MDRSAPLPETHAPLGRTEALEILALAGTAGAHLLTWNWPVLHAALVPSLVLGWTVWFTVRCRSQTTLRRELGITRAGLRPTLAWTLPLAALSILCFGAFAVIQGTLSLPWTLALLALSYPIWGLTQQLMVQGVLVRHLGSVGWFADRPWAIALAAGLLFGAVHWPFPLLMAGTSVMGAVFALVYLKHRNLWPLGVLHGWVGALFFLWVMDKDPMAELLAGLASSGAL